MSGKREDYLSWDDYFMNLAKHSCERSKDPNTQVGACIVDSANNILSLGYNGATKGFPDDEFPWDSTGEKTGEILQIKNTFVVHAELNAILNYRGNHSDLENATLYVSLFPCHECAKAICQSGIRKVVYEKMYRHSKLVEAAKIMFQYANVEVVQYTPEYEFVKIKKKDYRK